MNKCNIGLDWAIDNLSKCYIKHATISDKYIGSMEFNASNYRVNLAVASGELTAEQLYDKLKALSPHFKKKGKKK